MFRFVSAPPRGVVASLDMRELLAVGRVLVKFLSFVSEGNVAYVFAPAVFFLLVFVGQCIEQSWRWLRSRRLRQVAKQRRVLQSALRLHAALNVQAFVVRRQILRETVRHQQESQR